MIVHEYPDEAVREKGRILGDLKRRRGTAAFNEAIAELILKDLWFLIRYALDWHFFDEEIHGKLFMSFYAERENKDTLLCVPRGHCKTMFKCARNIQRICANPDIAIMAVSATDGLAKAIGGIISTELRSNPILQTCFPHLPRPDETMKQWGAYAYQINKRQPRLEPTLLLSSIQSNQTGYHPDIIDVDDITVEKNNNPPGWAKQEAFLANGLRLLPPHGKFDWTGTRWSDADPLGKAITGEILGKQGRFEVMQLSCFVDDDPEKDPIFPAKARWNSSEVSGFPKEQLIREMHDPQPKNRRFFSCQMRNDPMPREEQKLNIDAIKLFSLSDVDEKGRSIVPKFQPCSLVGVEVTGGGLVVYNLLEEQLEKQGLTLPLKQIAMPNTRHVEKADRIHATLEPIINDGRLHIPHEMMPKDQSNTDCLGYELRRLGAARHDDMADCLHMIPEYLIGSIYPVDKEDAHLYICCDLAYSEKLQSDYTVFMAMIATHSKHLWLLGMDRFQESKPTVICNRLIQFYLSWNARATGDAFFRRRKKRSFAGSYR